MPTTELFTADDLNALPGISGITADEAAMVERVVWGWLLPVLKVTQRPDPVTPSVFSWAVQLGAIYSANTVGLSSKTTGPFQEQYSMDRIEAILKLAGAGGTPGGVPSPVGSFPSARAYPDPVERC